MVISGIYGILNIYNEKIYVGSAVKFQYRWKNHRIALQYNKHVNRYLQAAYNKHWNSPFIFTVLEYVEDLTKLIEREQYYIDLLRSADREFGYNLSPTAGSCLGTVHTDETKLNWSNQRIGQKRTGEALEALRAGATKRKETYVVSEETKKKLSESHKGKKHGDNFKKLMSERLKGNEINSGRIQTDAHKLAISKSRIGHITSKETRLKIAEANRGSKRSVESRAKMSAAAKQRHRREEKDLLWTW